MHEDRWNIIPKDNAWRQVTLASIEALQQKLWLRCDECAHDVITTPAFMHEKHGLDWRTPLLTISRSLRCSCCGSRKAACRPKPYGIGDR